jgi:hypothetical protein
MEPVSPHPRIEPHQPRREIYSNPQTEQKTEQTARVRRRFYSMRELVDKLKESFRISRVNYTTTELEMHKQGLAIAEEVLISQLLQLKIPHGSIDDLFQQMRRQSASVILSPDHKLATDNYQLFPVSISGLFEYCLVFSNLQVKPDRQESRIFEEISNHGRFARNAGRLRLVFCNSPPESNSSLDAILLQLDIQILVGAIEIDDA